MNDCELLNYSRLWRDLSLSNELKLCFSSNSKISLRKNIFTVKHLNYSVKPLTQSLTTSFSPNWRNMDFTSGLFGG